MPPFLFLSNHGLVLLCIAQDPAMRMRDIAAHLGITERAAQRIVADLVDTGYVARDRVGRRNLYSIQPNLQVEVPANREIDLNDLLNVLLPEGASTTRRNALPRVTTEPRPLKSAGNAAA